MIPSQGFTFESFSRGFLGIITVLAIAYIFSNKKNKIAWKTVILALLSQLLIGILILKVPFVQSLFEKAGAVFVKLIDFTREGTIFVFGDLLKPKTTSYIWAFEILPTVIFFSAITSILFYFGIIQKVVSFFAKLYTKFLKISGSESLSVIGNIFLGQTESPLLIKAYLSKMNKSEVLLVMIGGMATVAGGVLAAYIAFLGGDDPEKQIEFAKHLLTASVMAAPGAILISKIIIPQSEKINSDINISDYDAGSNILDAISNGTIEGIKLAVNIGAMVLVFIALIAMVNHLLFLTGDISGLNSIIEVNTIYSNLSLEAIMGIIFSPLMWLIGVASADIVPMGQLLGIKLSVNEFIAYMQLADFKIGGTEVVLSYEKSLIMATYMLCGFANFSSIGIQIGGIGALAPNQRKNLAKFGIKALIGGALASLLSAAIAGMLIG
ncbi:MAG: Na+ dependent nucleoside transporter [Flavobacteriaceae bacterium]|nr:Na+ dependent nucleoside transporter [Flavobacteriaceae bacterium]MBL6684275.1 Na+ dependent nucleoside transporter [Flavobacteriaceae bacterium]